MIRKSWPWLAALAACVVLVAAPIANAVAQGRDRTPPTAPTNLRVTAATSYTASLAWDPSSDNSGTFSYRIHASSGATATVGSASASFNFASGLTAGTKYSFTVHAVDAAGNRSRNSNAVTVTLPADRSAPTAPVVSLGDVTATTVALSWSAALDDGPYVTYQVLLDGSLFASAGGNTSFTLQGLAPSTTYSLSVRGRDNWQNWSPVSNELAAVTAPTNPSDTTPPSAPSNLTDNGMTFGDGETWLFWGQSTDNEDPQPVLRYEVFVNGRLDHTVVGRGSAILYADVPGPNTFTVVAVDVAGNRSHGAFYTP